jgi:hypothetical protein
MGTGSAAVFRKVPVPVSDPTPTAPFILHDCSGYDGVFTANLITGELSNDPMRPSPIPTIENNHCSIPGTPTMPFIHVFDENTPEDGPQQSDYQYEPAKARFKPEKLSPTSRLFLETLRAIGGTHFRVTYDGGNDEGWAHPDHIKVGDKQIPADSLLTQLVNSSLILQIRDLNKGQKRDPYVKANDKQVADWALEAFVYEIATALLGEGFGTGEYMLYGAFTVNLLTGEIVDDPKAPYTPASF